MKRLFALLALLGLLGMNAPLVADDAAPAKTAKPAAHAKPKKKKKSQKHKRRGGSKKKKKAPIKAADKETQKPDDKAEPEEHIEVLK